MNPLLDRFREPNQPQYVSRMFKGLLVFAARQIIFDEWLRSERINPRHRLIRRVMGYQGVRGCDRTMWECVRLDTPHHFDSELSYQFVGAMDRFDIKWIRV